MGTVMDELDRRGADTGDHIASSATSAVSPGSSRGPQVFDGLRVVDLTDSYPGALATMVLADNGAAVVHLVPTTRADDGGPAAPGAVQWARGKKHRIIDLTTADGTTACQALLAAADVVVESLGQDQLAIWGLDRAAVESAHPGIIYFSIDGFGSHPLLKSVPAHEGVVHAAAGRMMEFGKIFKLTRPAYSSSPVAGLGAAMAAVQGVAAALYEGTTTGRWGRSMRTSLARCLGPFDLASWVQVQFPADYPANIRPDHPMLPYTPARAKDGVWLQFASLAPHLFWKMADELGIGALRENPAFASLPSQADPSAMHAFWGEILTATATRTSDEWMELFLGSNGAGIDVVRDTQRGIDHPQAVHNGDVVQVDHEGLGTVLELGPLAKMSATPSHITDCPKPWAAAKGWRPRTPSAAPSAPHGGLPLAGTLVVEAAAYVAAPLAPVLLADLGARVIKLEPLEGDPLRGVLGFRLQQGKESVAVNLKAPEGAELASRILARADAFIHNYRPGVPERLGIDYPSVRKYNPRIVYLYAGAYGADGPYSGLPAFHPIAGAIAGNAALQVGDGQLNADREWDLEALKETSLRLFRANEGHPDMVSGCVYASAIVMGLLARARTGEGQYIQATMLGANAYLMSDDWVRFEGKPQRRRVDAELYGTSSLNRLYRTADGWVFLAVTNEREWRSLCSVVAPELGGDQRFAGDTARAANDAALAQELASRIEVRGADELERGAAAAGLGCVRADRGTYADYMARDAALGRSEVTMTATHPTLGDHWRHQRIVDFGSVDDPAKVASEIGQQTEAIMVELGYSVEERQRLVDLGVVHVAEPSGVSEAG
jgi:crotonobetainyl-CoA:carnitine CoA-transferase CaiB-like acyl-CoA transferase